MKALAGFLLLALVVLLLRSTALSNLATRGVMIDALVFATVVYALRNGDAWGSTFGFVLGVVADVDAARWLGRHALVLALLGYGVGRLASTLVRDSARTQIALFAIAAFMHQVWSAAFELGAGVATAPWLLGRALLAAVLTAAAGTLILTGLRRVLGQPVFGHASGSAATN